MDEGTVAESSQNVARTGFWTRHLRPPATRPQKIFDVCVGIVAPVLCLYYDPAVFTMQGLSGRGVLYGWRLAGYSGIVLGITCLAYYLFSRRASAFLAGALLGGAAFSIVIGVVLLPLSALGLLIFVGVFGLTPFLTSFVFFRNAYRCWGDMRVGERNRSKWIAVLAFVLVCGIPLALQSSVDRIAHGALANLDSASEVEHQRAIRKLRFLRFGFDTDEIVRLYNDANDTDRANRLAAAYRRITGKEIQVRLAELSD